MSELVRIDSELEAISCRFPTRQEITEAGLLLMSHFLRYAEAEGSDPPQIRIVHPPGSDCITVQLWFPERMSMKTSHWDF